MTCRRDKELHILHIEDNDADAVYIGELLSEDKSLEYTMDLALKLSVGLEYLDQHDVDIVLLDLSLPDSEGMNTFHAVKKAVPDLPVIVMTGLADEDLGVKAVQEGAQDYLIKSKVDTDLLVRSMRYAVEREKLVVRLREASKQIRELRELLPICAHCKNIRDDQGFWRQVEEYVTSHTEVQFSHGICPVCAKKFYPYLLSDTDE